MAAFNWINVEAECPVCRVMTRLRCQTHVASDYAGDETGRFHDREYDLGGKMAWWARGDKRFGSWPAGRWRVSGKSSEFDEEACSSACANCGSSLFVVIRFHENVPERVALIGKEEDWPEEFLK